MLLIILQDLFILSGVCSNRAQILGELIKKYKSKFQYENSPDRVIFLNGQTKYIEIGVDKYVYGIGASVVGKISTYLYLIFADDTARASCRRPLKKVIFKKKIILFFQIIIVVLTIHAGYL